MIKIFHKHDWEILDTYKFDEELSKFRGVSMDGFTAKELATRGVITVVKCKRCNKIKHIKTIL